MGIKITVFKLSFIWGDKCTTLTALQTKINGYITNDLQYHPPSQIISITCISTYQTSYNTNDSFLTTYGTCISILLLFGIFTYQIALF